jgi:RNA polymerase sigma factor (sigma-70 family)
MSSGEKLRGVVRHLRDQLGEAPADVELLARYAQRRDEAAFAALVRRHGGLVFGVACRQLADRQQAEDVFQATFLALARSAPRLGRQASLANWLYTVALRQARKARYRAARRAAREQALGPRSVPPADPLAEISGRELVGLIDEELARLPEAYRLPLLLCCVQGLSRDEAARQLGWSDGAVKGRLERGRRQLAARLARRGVMPSALVLAPLAAPNLPNGLLARTAALAAAPWSKALPAAVVSLAAAGTPTRLLPAALLVLALLVARVVGLVVRNTEEATRPESPARTTPAPPAPDRRGDPLPAGSTLRFGTSRYRHGTAIEGLAVSADDRIAVAASGNHWLGSTRAFDLATGRVVYNLGTQGNYVEAVALSPDGRTLATHQGTAVHLHDAATGKEIRKIALPNTNPRSITQWLTFAPDGKMLAAASEGQVIHLLDIDKQKVVRSFPHRSTVFAAAFSPDGTLLAGGGYDGEGGVYFARLWEVASGKELRRCAGGKGGIRTLAFSPDGATLAGGGDDGRLRLFDVATGKERLGLPANGSRVRAVAFAPDGRTVAAAGAAICLYDPASGQERLRINRQARGLHFSADGRTLTAAVGGAIYRWDAATGQVLTPQAAADSAIDQILVPSDGRRVLTREQLGKVHVWDAGTGRHLRSVNVEYAQGVALSPDGRWLAWSVRDPNVRFKDPGEPNTMYDGSRICLYDLTAGRQSDHFPGFAGYANELWFTADGTTLVTVDHRDGTVRLWDVATGKERRSFRAARDQEKGRSYMITVAALSPDGRTLAVGHRRRDNTTALFSPVAVRLWDVPSGRELHELTGHTNVVLGLAFAPDSRLLVTCSENPHSVGLPGLPGAPRVDLVLVWDVATGKRVAALPEGLPIGAGSAAFAPDGRTLATASADGLVRLWEVATWTVRASFQGHRDRVTALAFEPDGRLLSGSLDTTVLAWDVRPPRSTDGPLAATWEGLGQTEAAPAFRAQGRLLAAPAEAVALLAARLKPAQPVDAQRLAVLVADLDSPQFTSRKQAADALRQLGKRAAPALRQAEQKAGSLETRRRAGALLAELEKSPPAADELRALRAVEVLEWLGTADARRLLIELAGGDPEAPLTQAPGAALKRLKASSKSP